ncbi:hypothetical protein Kpho02_69820 [Kitasatospora phosalacinea]|uniref:Uncharacterized protein n=1 Tax=Kitasatospora phosalacinea TaxID=2065 RepID=A0A9W6QCM8_9ACTN|nr:hypothetical protein Kpho02_69820 [Kitasatospora phosalacinea]
MSAVATTTRPDGTPLAITTSEDETGIVWDLTTGDRLHILRGHSGPVSTVATTTRPDGTPLAITTSEDRSSILWNPCTGQVVERLQLPYTGRIAAGTDAGFVIAYGENIACFVWNPGPATGGL